MADGLVAAKKPEFNEIERISRGGCRCVPAVSRNSVLIQYPKSIARIDLVIQDAQMG